MLIVSFISMRIMNPNQDKRAIFLRRLNATLLNPKTLDYIYFKSTDTVESYYVISISNEMSFL